MVSPTAATFYFYKSFWSVLRSQALETPQPVAPKPPRPSPEPSPQLCWTWPGSAPKPPGTFSVEPSPDLALHQSLPDLLRNLLRNPVELTWLCTKASQTFSGTFFGTLLNLTWLCTKASQTFSGTFGTFSGTSLNLTRRLHQCTPELFWAEDPISLRSGLKTPLAYTVREVIPVQFKCYHYHRRFWAPKRRPWSVPSWHWTARGTRPAISCPAGRPVCVDSDRPAG